MEDTVCRVDHIKFDIEDALQSQLGAIPLPFTGMDKSSAAICEFYSIGKCQMGVMCPYRHVRGDKSVVCKHWLRGLCKKGDDCEFLHEYDMSKMPECYFFSKFGMCSNKDCPFLHIDPEQKIKDCPWYDRGFCRHGPNCKNRHVRRVMCMNYLAGLCIDGKSCKFVHVKFDLPQPDPVQQAKKATILCHYCNEVGHKAISCPKASHRPQMHHAPIQHGFTPNDHRPISNLSTPPMSGGSHGSHDSSRQSLRPLDEVTCFKCGEKGHYANKCPKGHLAFLSNNSSVGM